MQSARVLRSGRRLLRRSTAVILVGTVAAGLAIAALPSSPGRASTLGRETVVRVLERDFSISAPKSAPAGDLKLVVRNNGPDAHELIIVRDSSLLPLRSDGLTVNEEALRARTVSTSEASPAGRMHEVSLHLAPGRYVLFCNMAGHYLGGMHTELVVRR